jgi:hypothetical protein
MVVDLRLDTGLNGHGICTLCLSWRGRRSLFVTGTQTSHAGSCVRNRIEEDFSTVFLLDVTHLTISLWVLGFGGITHVFGFCDMDQNDR